MHIKDWKKEVFTIPNLLSLFRLALIPVYIYIYLGATETYQYITAGTIMAVSCLTDLIDGKVARRFNMVSTLGKILDPLADKITQFTLTVCLSLKHPQLFPVLALFVVILPLFARDDLTGVSYPWFCKYICPSGTLMGGWTLLSLNEKLRGAAGWLFTWKSALLVAIIVLSMKSFRPFCKYLCPLGAFYGFFNRIALFRYGFDEKKCVACGRCAAVCPMTLKLPHGTNGAECIRCGRCVHACPVEALTPALKQSLKVRRKPSPERP